MAREIRDHVEDKGDAKGREIASIHIVETRFKLRPHLVLTVPSIISGERIVLTATVAEILRSKLN